jgi:hypothetical protein
VGQQFDDEQDISASLIADQQGIGSGQDLINIDSWPDSDRNYRR